MPYIKKEERAVLDRYINALREFIANEGELNYTITRLCDSFMNWHGKSYAEINKIIGVLECVKQEFYRRVASPYEDTKIDENGDVYDDSING